MVDASGKDLPVVLVHQEIDAARLLEAAIHDARDVGCAVLRLESRGGNVAAHRLFERHGFAEAAEVGEIIAAEADGVRLRVV